MDRPLPSYPLAIPITYHSSHSMPNSHPLATSLGKPKDTLDAFDRKIIQLGAASEEVEDFKTTIITILRMVELRFMKEILQTSNETFNKTYAIGALSVLVDALEREYSDMSVAGE